jgi:hypothetical protein
MSEEDYQKRYDCESRRRREIMDFRAQQRISREWIPVDEIIEWCVASQTGAGRAEAETVRSLAYDRLDQSAGAGEFETEVIKWIHPRFGEQWLTREALSHLTTIRDLAAQCWLSRARAREWLGAHGYPWPAHFDPPMSATSAINGDVDRPAVDRTDRHPPLARGAPVVKGDRIVIPGKREADAKGQTCPIVRKTKLVTVQQYIAVNYPKGIPAEVTDKTIARATGVSERTVRRARHAGESKQHIRAATTGQQP